jgi:hypothetical protein
MWNGSITPVPAPRCKMAAKYATERLNSYLMQR